MALEVSFKRLKQLFSIVFAAVAAWMFCAHYIRVDTNRIGPNLIEARLSFAVPVSAGSLEKRLAVQTEAGNLANAVSVTRNSLLSWTIRIHENPTMRGLRYDLRIEHVPSVIPLMTITRTVKVHEPIRPSLLGVFPSDNIPSGGPVIFKFDTPMDGSTLSRGIRVGQRGTYTAIKGSYMTQWSFYPITKLRNSSLYSVRITKGVLSKYGKPLSRDYRVDVKTAPRLGIVRVYPAPGSSRVWLSRNIHVEFDGPIKDCTMKLGGEKGVTKLQERSATFVPDRILSPGTEYKVDLLAVSKYNERLAQSFNFTTTDIGGARWVEIKLLTEDKARLSIREGKKTLCSITGNAGDNSELLPAGTLYVVESGRDWIRLNADILIHSSDPAVKLHTPAAYGSIALSSPEMKRLSEALPKNAMVIVHR